MNSPTLPAESPGTFFQSLCAKQVAALLPLEALRGNIKGPIRKANGLASQYAQEAKTLFALATEHSAKQDRWAQQLEASGNTDDAAELERSAAQKEAITTRKTAVRYQGASGEWARWGQQLQACYDNFETRFISQASGVPA